MKLGIYRCAVGMLTVMLAAASWAAWSQRKELDALQETLRSVAFHSVQIAVVDADDGSLVMTTVKGPMTRTLIFPIGVNLDRRKEDSTVFQFAWYGHPTTIELTAPGYEPTRVALDSAKAHKVVVKMRKTPERTSGVPPGPSRGA